MMAPDGNCLIVGSAVAKLIEELGYDAEKLGIDNRVRVIVSPRETNTEVLLKPNSENGWYNKFNKRNKRKNFKG